MTTDFVEYLDAWLEAQGVLMHATTLERIADGAEEFYGGAKRSFEQWQADLDARNQGERT